MKSESLNDQLLSYLRDLLGNGVMGATEVNWRLSSREVLVPNTNLRLALESDPAMSALLPGSPGAFSLGEKSCALFKIRGANLILLSPTLHLEPSALAVAARWGMEALHRLKLGRLTLRHCDALIRFGRRLVRIASPSARDLLLGVLPEEIGQELWAGDACWPSQGLQQWMADMIGISNWGDEEAGARASSDFSELEGPLEDLMIAGGDSRLTLLSSGLNKYGVCPRPRPEAVQFSSSTASAVSGHGFLFAEQLRWSLIELGESDDAGQVHQALAASLMKGVARLLCLATDEMDYVITASGTDAELVSVLMAVAGGEGRPVTNLLVSPEESGTGVRLAGGGRYFDALSATQEPIRKGEPAIQGASITVTEVPIRDAYCHIRPNEEVDQEIQQKGIRALEEGHHLLVHLLAGSKTGLSAPSLEAIEKLVELAPTRVDVVVDACQMRSSWVELGEMVRKGWMVQVSGSKFLTGPPFSGALLLPTALRSRRETVLSLMAGSSGVSVPDDWSKWWADGLLQSTGRRSLGPLFRWLPALLEGHLFGSLTEGGKLSTFEGFRQELVKRFKKSDFLCPLEGGVDGVSGDHSAMMTIMSFQVIGKRWNDALLPLTEKECLWLYERLNSDVSDLIPDLSPGEVATARLECHIGQPVILTGQRQKMAFLRLVVGARFFNMVGHAHPLAQEAMLQSQIADACRVLDKIELIASRWWRFAPQFGC
jgi:hypothetical protein